MEKKTQLVKVTCLSGVEGHRARLHALYEDRKAWVIRDHETGGLLSFRLGFPNAINAWHNNPVIEYNDADPLDVRNISRLAFPDEKFTKVFPTWTFDDAARPPNVKLGLRQISPYMMRSYVPNKGNSRHLPALWVSSSNALVKWIEGSMIPVNYDTIHFKMLHFESGITHIWSEYGQIIGDRLLMQLRTEHLPEAIQPKEK